MQNVPHRNGKLRKLRSDRITRYSSGSAIGDDSDALGEDVAAKFLDSGLTANDIRFDHYICTYTDKEMISRVEYLDRTAAVVRTYGIEVEIESNLRGYTLRMRKPHTHDDTITPVNLTG